MGFFSDLKEDLAVAVNELMPVDGEETTADTAADAVQETAEEAVPAAGTVKAEPEKEILKEQILEVNTEKVSGETSRMPWDAPYMGQKDVYEPDEQAISEAAGVSEDVHEPDEQTSQESDTDTTTERDS